MQPQNLLSAPSNDDCRYGSVPRQTQNPTPPTVAISSTSTGPIDDHGSHGSYAGEPRLFLALHRAEAFSKTHSAVSTPIRSCSALPDIHCARLRTSASRLEAAHWVQELGGLTCQLTSEIMSEAKEYELYDLGDFTLKSGAVLKGAQIAYKTFGSSSNPAIIYPSWYSGGLFSDLSSPTYSQLRYECRDRR